MKPTAQRLSEVFCRPTTEGEWDELDIQNPFDRKEFPFVMMQGSTAWQVNYTFNRTQIPVSKFIDLIKDAICAWRLESDGFLISAKPKDCYYAEHITPLILIDERCVVFVGNVKRRNIKTYTDLITLITLLK